MIKKLTLLSLLITLFANTLFAQADKALVQRYMQISGTQQAVESIAQQIIGSMQQSAMMYGESVDEKEVRFIKKAFNPYDDIQLIKSTLSTQFDNRSLRTILDFYSSELGRKVTQAGLDVLAPSAQSELLSYMSTLQQNPPSKTRISLIKSLVNTLQLSQRVEDMLAEMMVYTQKQATPKASISNDQIKQFKLMMRQTLKQQLFLSSLFTYRTLSDAEIESVIGFYQTEAGEEELRVTGDALVKMFKEGFKKALKR